MTKEKKSKVWEISLLSVFGAIWLFGFILAILGMVAFNAPVATKDNPLYQAQKSFASFLGMKGIVDFRVLGSAILVIAMIFIIGFYIIMLTSMMLLRLRKLDVMKE